jgi:2-(1,2-epoxy-1,2-dihydrophenyl)acetyl-CoA isomerase
VLPFTKNLAIIGDAGITWVLPRLVGLSRARRMLLFNEKVPAQTALEWGLADRVCDDGEALTTALQAAQQLAAGPTRALAGVRRALWHGLQHDYERHLIQEVELNRPLFDSDDYREAKRAIVERRPPRFTGH